MDAILYGKTLLKRYMFYRIKGNIASDDVKSPVNVDSQGFISCRRRDLNPHAFEGNGF